MPRPGWSKQREKNLAMLERLFASGLLRWDQLAVHEREWLHERVLDKANKKAHDRDS